MSAEFPRRSSRRHLPAAHDDDSSVSKKFNGIIGLAEKTPAFADDADIAAIHQDLADIPVGINPVIGDLRQRTDGVAGLEFAPSATSGPRPSFGGG